VQKKAGTPPPAGTTKTTAIGTEHLKMTTPPDSQSWMEQLDVDGNGQVNSTTLTWDGKDKILFSTTSGSFTCQNGTTGRRIAGPGQRRRQSQWTPRWLRLLAGVSRQRPMRCPGSVLLGLQIR